MPIDQVPLWLEKRLRRETPYGSVIIPSDGDYRSIFAWDSGWNALWLEKLEPGKGITELTTLFRTQREDGRIPHETPWGRSASYGLKRRLQLSLLKASFAPDGTSHFIDPPVYLWLAREYLNGKRGRALEPGERLLFEGSVTAKLNWLQTHRTLPDLPEPLNRLPLLLHPLESGTDMAPVFDVIYRGLPGLLAALALLPFRLPEEGWSLKSPWPKTRIPLLLDPTYLSFYLLTLQEGNELPAGLLEGYRAHLYNEDWKGFDTGFYRRGRLRRAPNRTFSSLLPFLLDIDDDAASASIARHALPGGTFFRGKLPSYNPASCRSSSRFLWRGSCSWMNMNYCHLLLLKKYGFRQAASELARRLRDSYRQAGLSSGACPEYREAFTLAPGGAAPFSWNGLINRFLFDDG